MNKLVELFTDVDVFLQSFDALYGLPGYCQHGLNINLDAGLYTDSR